MGAQLGIVYAECKDHKDFLDSCRKLGLVRAGAMQEASRRRGGPPKKSPAKERLTTIPEEASAPSTPPKRKSSKKAQEEAPGAPEKLKSLPEIERLRSDTAKDLRLLSEWLAEEQIGSLGPEIGRLNEATGEIEAL